MAVIVITKCIQLSTRHKMKSAEDDDTCDSKRAQSIILIYQGSKFK